MGSAHGDGVTIRAAIREDCDAIAHVRVAAWRAAYQGLVPDGALAALDPVAEGRARYARWPAAASDERYAVFVATAAGSGSPRVVGFIVIGIASEHGDVHALYVLPEHWGTGGGYALLRAGLDALADRGRSTVRLWVLDGNERAIRFYRRQGFVMDGRVQVDESLTPGIALTELGMTREPGEAAG